MITKKQRRKRSEYMRRYREKNPEKFTPKPLSEEQKQKHREYMREYREKNLGYKFRERERRKERYSENQLEEQRKAREYMRGYYLANKDNPEYKAKARKKYEERKAWFREFLLTLSCKACGENDPDCLEFHHPVPKGRENGKRIEPPVTTLLSRSKEFILSEAKKCIVLCANCHRKEHARLRREQA